MYADNARSPSSIQWHFGATAVRGDPLRLDVQREGRAEIMRRIAANPVIDRVIIESAAGQDQHDVRALQASVHSLGRRDSFHYEHRQPRHEPLLWAADAIVFSYAAGGDLRRRCDPLVTEVHTVAPHA